MQVDNIGLVEFGQQGDVGTCVGNVYGKEVVFLKVIGFPYNDTLPYELPDLPPRLLQCYYSYLFSLFVAYQHLCFDTTAF